MFFFVFICYICLMVEGWISVGEVEGVLFFSWGDVGFWVGGVVIDGVLVC